MMAFAACCHAAFQAVGQIVITDRVEGDDDFLLSGIRHRHLSIRGHAGIYVERTSEPGFSLNVTDEFEAVLWRKRKRERSLTRT
jgi:hypothetical protein